MSHVSGPYLQGAADLARTFSQLLLFSTFVDPLRRAIAAFRPQNAGIRTRPFTFGLNEFGSMLCVAYLSAFDSDQTTGALSTLVGSLFIGGLAAMRVTDLLYPERPIFPRYFWQVG